MVRASSDDQNVSLSSVAGYDDVVRVLDRIERTSHGLVTVASAGPSGEGRELLYATVGTGPTTSGCRPASTATNCTAPRRRCRSSTYSPPETRLPSSSATTSRSFVIPMYNPDGSEANIRQSTTPNQIDLNRDWENFAQPESVAFWRLWRDVAPDLALDLHHMGTAPVVDGTNDLNQFQIGARSIDPSRMTAEQWMTNRQMAMVSVDALDQYGLANVAHYPLIDITNAALSRMLMGGTAPAGEQPVTAIAHQGGNLLRGAVGRAKEQRPARETVPDPDDGGAHGGGERFAERARRVRLLPRYAGPLRRVGPAGRWYFRIGERQERPQ